VYSRANKILFKDKRAIGVEIQDVVTGKKTNILAKKEVILSAGAFDSPKLLLLSGIGSKDYLESFGIPVVSDVPGVGKNLQDHSFLVVSSAPLKNQSAVPDPVFGDWGVLVTNDDGQRYWGLSLGPNFVDSSSNVFSVFCETFHYQSRGNVTIRSTNRTDSPVINPNYLHVESDLDKTLQTVQQGLEFLRDPSMREFLGDPIDEVSPGASIDTPEELKEWIKNTLSTDFHPAGTCKMGDFAKDPDAVVDNRLRVRGVENLRVVDASIMPELVSGNPNQATVIIGLKAADMILEDTRAKCH